MPPGYRLRSSPKKFFIIGRVSRASCSSPHACLHRVQVFLILWAEPAGESAVSSIQPPALHIKGRYGQQVFSKVRRFVVIRENDRSCSALYVVLVLLKLAIAATDSAGLYSPTTAEVLHRKISESMASSTLQNKHQPGLLTSRSCSRVLSG